MFTYEDLTFRCVEEGDLETLRKLRNDESTWLYLTSPGMINPIQQQAWFESMCRDSSKQYLSIVFGDDLPANLAGLARVDEIDRLNRSARIGVDILPRFRGQGLGQKAMRGLMAFYFQEMGLHKLWLCVLENNLRAKHIYEKLGFIEDGRLREHVFRGGKYLDYIVMSILEGEYRQI